MNNNEITPVQIAIRIVIIIIVIALLLLISFALVRFVPRFYSSLGNFKNLFAGKERLTPSLDKKTVFVGEEAILTLDQKNGVVDGYYELSYSCSKIASDTHLDIKEADKHTIISCASSYNMTSSPSTSTPATLALMPAGKKLSYDQPMLITLKHIVASSTSATASITLTIQGDKSNDNATVATTSSSVSIFPDTTDSKPKDTEKTKTKTQTQTHATPAHLVANLKEVSVSENGVATVAFFVTNTGGKNSGAWAFTATLPRLGQTVFNSPLQTSIPPRGTSIMYLTFENALPGNIDIYVQNSRLTATLR